MAASPEPSAPAVVGTIDDFLASMGINGTAMQQIDAQVDQDGTDDFFNPAGGAATLDPGQADLTGNVSFESYLTTSVVQGLPACGTEVVCGDKGPPAAGQFAVFLVQMREPITQVAGAGLVVGVVYEDSTPLDGKPSEPLKLGKSNYLTGANAEYGAQFPPTGTVPSLVRLAHDKGEHAAAPLHPEETHAFALVRCTVLGIFVPQAEWDGAVGSRFFSSYDLTRLVGTVVDTSPEPDEDMDSAAAALLASDLPLLSPDLQYFGEASILDDKPISACEHVFTIQFKVSDSNAQSAIYEGRVIGYQAVVDGPMLNAFVGVGGIAVVTFDEHFTPDGPGCQSQLNPHVRTLDGTGVFG